MTKEQGKPVWAPKVAQARILRLYTTDAQGIVDEELIDEVGWALWSRCDSILTVTEAHHGRVRCPSCGQIVERRMKDGSELVQCGGCGWSIVWADYNRTYQGKQLYGANAVDVFLQYHRDFPRARTANAKMLLIDQLIHAFHLGLTEIGRPVAANLIQGSLKEVIRFLDALTAGSRQQWRETLESAEWSRHFIDRRD